MFAPRPAVNRSCRAKPACGENGRCYNPPRFRPCPHGTEAAQVDGPGAHAAMHARLPAFGLLVATPCLIACALALAQAPPGRGEWLLRPQLARGQEFTYSGWFTEETLGPGVQRQCAYKLHSTLMVLGATQTKWDVAFLTVLSRQDRRQGPAP